MPPPPSADRGPVVVSAERGGWRFWIDRGGTFTDLVGQAPDGAMVVRKVLSERGGSLPGAGVNRLGSMAPATASPPEADGPSAVGDDPREAGLDPAVAAIREVLGLAAADPLPPGLVEEVRLGTTVATNALLERRVEPALLLVNRGFADFAAIGDQHRPDIFALRIERPPLLPHRVLEVEGRLSADGLELEPWRPDPQLEASLLEARAAGMRGCAVALLHAVVNPAHELALGAWLEELGFDPVLLSHRVGGLPRLLPRLHTTLVEAAVRPVLQRYLAQVRLALGPDTRLRVMTSSGVLQAPEQLLAKDTVLSGPAGGVLGAVAVARAAGLADRPILGFDMGGTSTDVFHREGADRAGLELQPETAVAGLRLQSLSLPIHTVAAGGGSLVRLEGGRLQVGPESAGADPGPACYRRGGPLTITDANLLLGRLPEGSLPSLFGPTGDQPPDREIVRRRFESLAAQLAAALTADGEGGSAWPPPCSDAAPEWDGGAGPERVAGPEDGWDAAGGGHADPAPDRAISPEALAQGARSIAIERMADAIRRISIQRGHDIRGAVLVSYGGAGGQHACALAERLGIGRVLLHPLAGVLSAYGIGLSRQEALRTASVQRPLDAGLLPVLKVRREQLLEEASQDLAMAGDGGGERSAARVSLEVRPLGGERGLELPWPEAASLESLRRDFEHCHRQRFGYVVEGEALVVERLQVVLPAAGSPLDAVATGGDAMAAVVGATPLGLPAAMGQAGASGCGRGHASVRSGAPPEPSRWVPLCLPRPGRAPEAMALHWRQVPCWRRQELAAGQRLKGPAVLLEDTGTTVLEEGWGGRVLADGALLLEPLASARADAAAGADRAGEKEVNGPAAPGPADQAVAPAATARAEIVVAACDLDPVRLELYNHRFSAIAEQMGVRLQQSSRSVNIRERLDFSCALFDGAGRLVANAPHIPVHLGSMGESVASLLVAIARGERPPLQPGDAVASNDPYAGGTHLPDITVISPVFAPDAEEQNAAAPNVGPQGGLPLLYVACRGHHADVGGITPGSMPPFSRSIVEEGLRLDNVPLIAAGRFDLQTWQERLACGPHPVRDPARLLADLQAQVAANRLGEAELHRLIRQQGEAELIAAMAAVQANAAEAVRSVIDRLRPGRHAVELDDGSRIVVAVAPDHARRRVRVDFSGTSPQQSGNLNAPLAITKAVVLYVFRVLVARPIPLNAGCFEPIELIVPPGCLLHPAEPAAVVGGNVETSQAVANALFAALGVQAASQGTMNNLSFGNDRCQYYETVSGGSGAGLLADGNGFGGCDAVQSHMTNSRLTDPEILEARFPVRLERFTRRRGSGGAGRWRGGDGVVRQLRALQPLTLAILSGSRRVPPFGMAGGGAGRCGRNAVLRADGRREELAGSAQVAMAAGDVFLLETPGGGGWGDDPAALGPGGQDQTDGEAIHAGRAVSRAESPQDHVHEPPSAPS